MSFVFLLTAMPNFVQVPFRLTRMMIEAMEVSGIEGTFRATCELVMRVLRNEKQSLMAMLEAFVHDPLINWRLALNHTDGAATGGAPAGLKCSNLDAGGAEDAGDEEVGPLQRRDVRERDLLTAYYKTGDEVEVAIQVLLLVRGNVVCSLACCMRKGRKFTRSEQRAMVNGLCWSFRIAQHTRSLVVLWWGDC